MQDNLKAAAQRGNNLNDLEDKTYALNQSSSAFSSRAKAVRKRMWWKDMKMKVWIGVGITVIILIIIIAAVGMSHTKSQSSDSWSLTVLQRAASTNEISRQNTNLQIGAACFMKMRALGWDKDALHISDNPCITSIHVTFSSSTLTMVPKSMLVMRLSESIYAAKCSLLHACVSLVRDRRQRQPCSSHSVH